MIDPLLILQALTVASIIWFGKKVQTLAETSAVHSEKHRRHDERLNIVESKIC